MRAILVNDLKELAENEERWEALRQEARGTIFSSSLLVRTWLEAYSDKVSPRVIFIEENGELVGVAPMATHVIRIGGIPIKVLALAGEVSEKLYLATNSILYRPGREDVLERIVHEMKHLDWQLMTSIFMPDIEPVRSYQRMVAEMWHEESRPSVKLLTIPVPEKGEIIDIFDKNPKKNVKKALRLLEEGGHNITFRRIPEDDIGAAVDVYATQHIDRWATKGGSYFRDPTNVAFLRSVMQRTIGSGHGFAYELLIDGEIAAQNFGFLDGETALSYRTGINNGLMKHSPGWLIKKYGLEAMRDSGIKRFTLGIGGEEHKFRMGAEDTDLVGIRVSRGFLSAAMRIASTPAVKRLDSKYGILEKMMRMGSS